MKDVPSLIPVSNGELHDYEVSYVARVDPGALFSRQRIATHLVRQSKSIKNALASFSRACPGHGAIKSIRKVVLE